MATEDEQVDKSWGRPIMAITRVSLDVKRQQHFEYNEKLAFSHLCLHLMALASRHLVSIL